MIYLHFKDGTYIKFELNELKELCRFKLIKEGVTGTQEDDDLESFPLGEYELTYQNVISMYEFSFKEVSRLKAISYFKSRALDKFCLFIENGMKFRGKVVVSSD